MIRVWAIARQMIAEAIRMRVAVAFLVLLGLLLLGLPFAEGDGTLTGRVQALLTYTLSATLIVVSLVTIFLGCGSVANEIRDRQVHTIACKPIPRWQYVFGKWLGIVVFDFALLVAAGLVIYASIFILKHRPQYDEQARRDLRNQVLTARFPMQPTKPDFNQIVEQQFQRLREKGPLPELVADPEHTRTTLPGTTENIKKSLKYKIERQWMRLRPGESRTYLFENLLIDRKPDKRIYVRYNVVPEHLPPELILRFGWTVGDRSKGASAYPIPRRDAVERFHEIEVPATAVASDQTVAVTFHNFDILTGTVDYPTAVSLGGKGSIEVLFAVGTFEGNLARALGIILCILIFLAAFSVFTSTWLSFPVACLVTVFVWVTGVSLGFLSESVMALPSTNTGEEFTGTILVLLKPFGMFILWMMPDFAQFSPVGLIADGRVVTLVRLLNAIGNLVLFKGVLVGLIGAVIYQNRELAQVTA